MHQVHLMIKSFIALTAIKAATASETTKRPEATPIYIDRVPGYQALDACAVYPLSTIVRNMWGGCGDGAQLTSYSCFCTDSYSKFSWQISTAVAQNCGSSQESLATSAVDIFHSYCTYGSEQLTDSRYAIATTSFAVSTTASTTAPSGVAPSQTGDSLLVKAGSLSGARTRTIPLSFIVFSSALVMSLGYVFVV